MGKIYGKVSMFQCYFRLFEGSAPRVVEFQKIKIYIYIYLNTVDVGTIPRFIEFHIIIRRWFRISSINSGI